MIRPRPLLPPLAIAAIAVLAGTAHAAAPAGRESDPVVLTGAEAPTLLGAEPGRVVAFAWEDGWRQVPVQVDERKVVDYAAVRNGHQTSGRPFSNVAYADGGTRAGADPDPNLDADDEIAAMAMDAGTSAPPRATPPDGVEPGSRTSVRIVDPLGSDAPSFLYLFRSGGGLDPAAGRDYVAYSFDLLSGDYLTTYDFDGIPGGDSTQSGAPANPENSRVKTDAYSGHFASRWIGDGLSVTASGATGADILDGDKAQVNYGCGRSELTFSRGGGGFIANIDGPVRAIRSYIGANSGTYTQRDHVYYRDSEVATTYLRVHPGISTISQFLDYSPAAGGMIYRNSAAPEGVTIDGVTDPGLETDTGLGPRLDWEQTTGPQGSLTVINRLVTDMPGVEVGSYYEDDLTPAAAQCSGYADSQAWAASGAALRNAGQNTDPTLGSAYAFVGTRTTFFSGPGADVALASRRAAQVDSPLDVTAGGEEAGGLELRARRSLDLRAGGRIRARLRNTSESLMAVAKVCGRARGRLARASRCDRVRRLEPGATKGVRLRIRLRPAGAKRDSFLVRLRARSAGYPVARAKVRVRP